MISCNFELSFRFYVFFAGVGFAFQKCRNCYCQFEEIQSLFDEEDFCPRNKDFYDKECQYLEKASNDVLKKKLSTLYGINERSPLE